MELGAQEHNLLLIPLVKIVVAIMLALKLGAAFGKGACGRSSCWSCSR
jgi:hypothetical protein